VEGLDFSSFVAGSNCEVELGLVLPRLIIKSLDFQQYLSLRGNYFVHVEVEG
jgi:hypothetical protein